MSRSRRVVGLFRKASYSPNQHRTNDTSILEETLARLCAHGWTASRIDESHFDPEHQNPALAQDLTPVVPEADLYLNMCQGAVAANALGALEHAGGCILNRPSSVLACHRHRLVPAMIAAGIPFPATEIVDLATAKASDLSNNTLVQTAADAREPIWIKRGDVHAERSEDVVKVAVPDVEGAVLAFLARGIGRISLQRHVSGPVIKFYAIADRSFFRYYEAAAGPAGAPPEIDEGRLREVAFAAAAAVGLSIFGGDVVFRRPNEPVLIDLNDWPSFAPFRDDAADRIAEYARQHAEARARQPVASHAEARLGSSDASPRPTSFSPFAPDPV